MKKFFLKYLHTNIFIIFFIILTNLSQILAVLSVSNLLNLVITGKNALLIRSFIIIFLLWIVHFISDTISKIIQSRCIQHMNNDLRINISKYIQQLSSQEFNKIDTGTYVSWYTNDINEINISAFKSFYSIISSLISLLIVLYTLIHLNYILAFTMILSSIILVYFPKLFTKSISKLSISQSSEQEIFTKDIKDILGGFDVLRINNALHIFIEKISNFSYKLEENKFKFTCTRSKANLILGIINIASQLSCTFVAAYLASNGIVSYGTIIVAGNLSRTCFNSVSAISSDYISFIGGKKILDKINSKHRQREDNKSLVKFEDLHDSIVIKNLYYNYEDTKILHDINLVFEKGKKYAIIGPSGCGKSTLLNILIGNITDFDGEVLIDNINIKDYDISSIYHKFGYINQSTYLFNASVIDNITIFNNNYNDKDVDFCLSKSSLDIFMNKQSLERTVGENGKNLSGGQKQRLAIARAIFNKKNIIIMDEGTSSLDKNNSYQIEKSLLTNKDITLILVTHNMNNELEQSFDHIYNLSHLNQVIN